jgi:hypothetical protein
MFPTPSRIVNVTTTFSPIIPPLRKKLTLRPRICGGWVTVQLADERLHVDLFVIVSATTATGLARTLALGAETLALPLRPPHPVIGASRQLGLDFPEPQRIHFTLSRFDNGAETLSRPMCAEGVL